MKDFSEHLSHNDIFDAVQQGADFLSVPTYVVGGYVRDLILRRPCQDIDFVCVGDGVELAREVARRLQTGPVTVYKNFGTAHFKYKEYNIEFVGARKESYRADSRNPTVERGTLEDDQRRRDFTINALAIHVNTSRYGQLIDPFNGLEDMRNMLLRTPLDPNVTFSDDPLRMIRAIRFATQLNFDIEPHTFEAIRRNKGRLHIVAMERVMDEMNKIIMSPVPSYGCKLLFFSGLLHEFFPEMVALHGVDHVGNKAHKDNFFHTLQVLDNVAKVSDNLWLRWAAIMHDIGKPATKRFDPKTGWTFHSHEEYGARMVSPLFARFKLPLGERMNFVRKLVRLHLRPISLVSEVTDSAIRRLLFEAGTDLESLMILCRADITSKNQEKVNQYLHNFEKVEKKIAAVEAKDQVRQFQPPVSGQEIMQYLNISPGVMVGLIKEQIKEAILEGDIQNDKEQALALMYKIAKKKGLVLENKSG